MLTILYGSQTGTAEEAAISRIAREAYTIGYPYEVMPMDELPFDRLPTLQAAIFVCSTTGEGEEPDNMKGFWRALRRKDLPSTYLAGLKVGVFGLGDSSYEQYNYAGKKLYRRLLQLGAVSLLERGDGDEQHPLGYEGALVPWLDQLWLQVDCLAKEKGWEVTPHPSIFPKAILLALNTPELQSPLTEPLINAKLISNRRVSELDADVKDVRHLSFECNLSYEPGDVAVFKPDNSSEEVEKILTAFKWDHLRGKILTTKQEHSSFRPPPDFPSCFTIEQVLQTFLDLKRPPSRYFFEVLAEAVSADHPLASFHKEKLLELGKDRSAEGTASYLDYVWRPKRTPAEVIIDFPSVTVSSDFLFDLFPWIKPRSFSIASYMPGKQIDLLVALVKFKTIMKVERVGLCSAWFESMSSGQHVKLSINRGSMHVPMTQAPLVLMCAGTGIAPMLSIIQKIALQPSKPPVYLFFGCRKRASDAFFIDELMASHSSWLHVFCVGSRDGPKGVAKVYLQDILKQQAELVGGLLMNPESQWYLSGNSKLPAAVKKSLAEIVQSVYSLDGSAVIKQIVTANRFHSETWS